MLQCWLDQKVAVSRALAEALADNGLPGSKVIHNGLPPNEQPPAASVEAIRQRFQLGDEVVVGGGRMAFFKGQQQLLEAFSEVAGERPCAQLVLAGRHDDWFGALLKKRAAELRLEERVVFTGQLPRPEFLALLSTGALFGNLSLYLDPFPTVNLEAGAAGRAVLGTWFGGTPEAVVDGETGRLVNPYRLAEVTETLRSLLAHPDDRAELGRRAADRIRTVFPLQAMVDAYSSLFVSLV